MTVDEMRLLSSLLDQGMALPVAQRESWLSALRGEAAPLATTLRELLAKQASQDTADLIGQAHLAAAPGPGAGDAVGPYRLLEEIGHGGMGAVWLAERADGHPKRKVALKLPYLGWAPGLAERFARESQILAGLEHPHIARLYDAGLDDHGRPYMALEYVEGESIDAYCRARSLPVKARLALLLQVAEAVSFAHSRLVVHRDLKPTNIMVTAHGQVRLLDFGVAKLLESENAVETQLTKLAGRALTPDYASPEQILGAPIATTSDVYSLGVVAFELLTGARPYRLKRGTPAELEEAILAVEPPRASDVAAELSLKKALRGDLDAILQQALRKDPRARYASVGAFAEDVERHVRGEPVLARPDSRGYRLRKFVLRHRIPVGATVAALAAVVVGAGAAVWQASVARAQSAEARAQAALAKKEAQRAQAVQGFLFDLFRANSNQQADPLKAQQTTARELLDIGAARVSDALKDAPESEMSALNTLSDMYVQLGLRDRAIALQRRSVEVARRFYGPRASGRADALLGLISALQERPERNEIPALLAEAKAALDAAGERTTFLRGALLTETARHDKHEAVPIARDSADAAVAFLRQYQPQRATLVTASRLAGQARMNAGDYAGAEAQLRSAVDAARLRGPAAPAWLVGSLSELGGAQQAQMKFAAAESSLREALAHTLKVNGEAHRETLLTRLRLADLLLLTGRPEEGLAMQAEARAAMAREAGRYDSRFRALVDVLVGATALARGRPQDAVPSLVSHLEDRRAWIPRSPSRASTELALAESWIAMGRLDMARPMLADAVAHRTTSLGRIDDAAAWLPYWRVQAQLARADGDPRKAIDLLSAVPPAVPGSTGEEPIAIEIERSHALREAGRKEEAEQAARRALAALQAITPPYSLPHREAAAWETLGAAQAALGHREDASAAYSHALALRRVHDARGSRWRADDERVLASLRGPRAAAR